MEDRAQYEQDVGIIKEWYIKQPHLPQQIDEKIFYSFVSGTKSLEKCKSKLDAYLTLRNDVFEMFKDLGPTTTKFKQRFKYSGVVFLKGTTGDGCKVLFTAPNRHGFAFPDEVLIAQMSLVEIALDMWPTATSYVLVTDMQWAQSSALCHINMKRFSAYIKYLMKSIPIKMKKNIIINTPPYMETIFSVISHVMSKKAIERIQMCNDSSNLKDVLPEDMVPSDYGGKGPSLDELNDYWLNIIESRETWFEEKARLVCDESKRPRDSYRKETLDFGMEGSFKALNID